MKDIEYSYSLVLIFFDTFLCRSVVIIVPTVSLVEPLPHRRMSSVIQCLHFGQWSKLKLVDVCCHIFLKVSIHLGLENWHVLHLEPHWFILNWVLQPLLPVLELVFSHQDLVPGPSSINFKVNILYILPCIFSCVFCLYLSQMICFYAVVWNFPVARSFILGWWTIFDCVLWTNLQVMAPVCL